MTNHLDSYGRPGQIICLSSTQLFLLLRFVQSNYLSSALLPSSSISLLYWFKQIMVKRRNTGTWWHTTTLWVWLVWGNKKKMHLIFVPNLSLYLSPVFVSAYESPRRLKMCVLQESVLGNTPNPLRQETGPALECDIIHFIESRLQGFISLWPLCQSALLLCWSSVKDHGGWSSVQEYTRNSEAEQRICS